MLTLAILDDSPQRAQFLGTQLAKALGVKGTRAFPVLPLESMVPLHPSDFGKLAAREIASSFGNESTGLSLIAINLNLSDGCPGEALHRLRRSERTGLHVVEALRRQEKFSGSIYAYSFENVQKLEESRIFRLLFHEFRDCHRFLRLPFRHVRHPLAAPHEMRLRELSSTLKATEAERVKDQTASALRQLVMRYAHDQRSDLCACLGPVKAALRAGCCDLATRPEGVDMVRASLDQVKIDANSLCFESVVREAVLSEIGRLEALWEVAAEAIGRIRHVSGSPEREWDSAAGPALERLANFEERILELQRG